MLNEKLDDIKNKLVVFGDLVEQMIAKSVKGLISKDKDLLNDVIRLDEPQANNKELLIDELCTNAIAQFSPMAKELRTLLMVLQIGRDLERIADHAVNIAGSALFLIDKPAVKPLIDIPAMSDHTQKMLKDSIKSFLNEDVGLAQNVCERDNFVDELRVQIIRELSTYMSGDPSTVDRALHLIRISGNIERIADLATNIGEDVLFMVKGKVIKHNSGL